MAKTPEIYLQIITDVCVKTAVLIIFTLDRMPKNLWLKPSPIYLQ